MRILRSTVLLGTLLGSLNSPQAGLLGDESTISACPKPNEEVAEVDAQTALRIRNAELEHDLGSLREMVEMYRNFVGELQKFSKENAELRVKNAELQARLEVTEALAAAQFEKLKSDHKLAIANERLRRLKTGPTTEQPVAARSASVQNVDLAEAVQDIQEDLANIRRQIPLMRRAPIPFAVSNSIPSPFDYIPIGPKLQEVECGCEGEGESTADTETAHTGNRVAR